MRAYWSCFKPREHSAEGSAMGGYLRSWWVRIGLMLLIVGAGPLVTIIVLANIGLWPDRNPNPIGPGLLFALMFYPAVFCLFVGIVRVRMARKRALSIPATRP
ncbi:MAG TPA: hypothetical protein VK714_05755 [Myxococcota bacterium]|nr:hypothetical protein [Myxococcota bacterium]